MRVYMKWIVAVMIGLFVTINLIGCHTVEGIGRDIERGGEAIQDAAN